MISFHVVKSRGSEELARVTRDSLAEAKALARQWAAETDPAFKRTFTIYKNGVLLGFLQHPYRNWRWSDTSGKRNTARARTRSQEIQHRVEKLLPLVKTGDLAALERAIWEILTLRHRRPLPEAKPKTR